MNRTNQYFTRGLWVFVFLTVGALTGMFAVQAKLNVLSFVCYIMVIILAFGLLFFVLQANRALWEREEEIVRLRQREKTRLQRWRQATDDNDLQHQEVFNGDEMLARIIPAAGTDFESVTGYTENVLQNIAKELDIVQGLIFVMSDVDQLFHISGQYAYYSNEQPQSFSLGETLSGQVAKNRKLLNVKELPEGYITVLSGLGKSTPQHLIIAPIVHNYKSIGVMELASFKPFGENEELLVSKICESMSDLLNEIKSV